MNGPYLFDPILKTLRKRLPSAEKQNPYLFRIAFALSAMVGVALYDRWQGWL